MISNRKNRTLLLLIAVLLITNSIMLYLLTRPRIQEKEPEISRAERMVKMVQEELQLDSAQVNQYLILRSLRDSITKPIQAELRSSKMEMMQFIRNDSVDVDSLKACAQKVGDKQALIELEYYYHFKRMQQMLTPAQQPKFDSLLVRMVYRNTGSADSIQRAQEKEKQVN